MKKNFKLTVFSILASSLGVFLAGCNSGGATPNSSATSVTAVIESNAITTTSSEVYDGSLEMLGDRIEDGAITGLTMTWNGQYAYATNGTYLLWYHVRDDGKLEYLNYNKQSRELNALSVTMDDGFLYVTATGGWVYCFQLMADGSVNLVWSGQVSNVDQASIAASRNNIIYTVDHDYINEYKQNSDKSLTFINKFGVGDKDGATSIAISHDGKNIYVGNHDGWLNWYSIDNNPADTSFNFPSYRGHYTFDQHTGGAQYQRIYSLSVSPDGKYLYAGGILHITGYGDSATTAKDNKISIMRRDDNDGHLDRVYSEYVSTGVVMGLGVTPDGKYLYSSSSKGYISTWHVNGK